MESLPFGAWKFGLEPVHIRVLSPLGAFHVLQTSFYGRINLVQIQIEGRGKLGKPDNRMTQSSRREACSQVEEQKKEDEPKRHWTGNINGTWWNEKGGIYFLIRCGSNDRNLSLHRQFQSSVEEEVGNDIKSPHAHSSLPHSSWILGAPSFFWSSHLLNYPRILFPSSLPWETFWKGNLHCCPHFLVTDTL